MADDRQGANRKWHKWQVEPHGVASNSEASAFAAAGGAEAACDNIEKSTPSPHQVQHSSNRLMSLTLGYGAETVTSLAGTQATLWL